MSTVLPFVLPAVLGLEQETVIGIDVDFPEFDVAVTLLLDEIDVVLEFGEVDAVHLLDEVDVAVEELLLAVTIGSALPPPTPVHAVAAAFSGAGVLTADTNQFYTAAASLEATGELSAAIASQLGAAAAFTTTGVLTASTSQRTPIAAVLTGTGTLSATVTAAAAAGTYPSVSTFPSTSLYPAP